MSGALIIGVDVGGTNTDAVARTSDGQVVATSAHPTTSDVTDGVRNVLVALAAAPGVEVTRVRAVMIGTTHFTNALATSRGLNPVGCLRLGRPFTTGIPPFSDWPAAMVTAVEGHGVIVSGGCDYDGTPYAPLNPAEIRAAAAEMGERGVRGVAISAPFSPVNTQLERDAATIVAEVLGDVAITCSAEIGTLGLLPRENAALLNASLADLAATTIDSFTTAARDAGFEHAAVWFSQNDGTVADAATARRFPVHAISAGPTNSMRGAAILSGETDCAVVDVGGTTSDISILRHGFVRPAGQNLRLGGVLTNFAMPEVVAVPLGGGSRVHPAGSGGVTVGPDSVGHRLTSDARVFGGATLTASDLAVAAGHADFGDHTRVADLHPGLVTAGLDQIATTIATTLDRLSPPLPVVLVGGGAGIVADLPGWPTPTRPEHGAHANALGAAAAEISGTVDEVVATTSRGRDQVLDQARHTAAERALAAGADPATLRVVAADVLDLPYMPGGNDVRVRVTVVGGLDLACLPEPTTVEGVRG